MSRRGFLGLAVLGAAALVPAGCAADYPEAEEDGLDLKSLTPKEYAVARAAAAALLVGVPVKATTVATRIDQELAWVGDPVRKDMKSLLSLMEHATPLAFKIHRFTALSAQQRLAYLNTWKHSRFQLRRAAYQGLKGFVYYFAYIDPATRQLTGFQGPWAERVKIPAYPVDFGEIV